MRSNPVLPAEVARAVEDQDRLAVLRGLEMLDTAADADFDRVSTLAAAVMKTPIALVTLLDNKRQWFKSCLGLDETETATDISFCAHAIAAGDEPMVVAGYNGGPAFRNQPAGHRQAPYPLLRRRPHGGGGRPHRHAVRARPNAA